jgi:hypothetical protein
MDYYIKFKCESTTSASEATSISRASTIECLFCTDEGRSFYQGFSKQNEGRLSNARAEQETRS